MIADPLQDLARWQASGQFLEIDGRRVFYQEAGEGPPLVCLHGFPTSSWDWSPLWSRLAARFRVIAPDFIGFGFSAKPRDWTYALVDQATIVEELLRQRGVARCHVLAHDYGVSVAQEFLARVEEREGRSAPGLRVDSVLFLNGGLIPESHRPTFGQRMLESPLGPLFAQLMTEKRFAASLRAVFGPRTKPDAHLLQAYWQLVSRDGGTQIAHKLISYMAERRRRSQRWVGALQRARIPLRLVNGPEDPVSGRHLAQAFERLVPNADVVYLEGIGHYPQVEDPDGVWRAFEAFHARIAARGA